MLGNGDDDGTASEGLRDMSLLTDRKIDMATRVLNGETYKAVAESYGISCERVRQITMQVIRTTRAGAIRAGEDDPPGRDIISYRGHKHIWLTLIDRYVRQ